MRIKVVARHGDFFCGGYYFLAYFLAKSLKSVMGPLEEKATLLRNGGTLMTAEQKGHVIQLRGNGKSYNEISKALGISVNTIKSFCRRACVDGQSKDIKSVGTCKQCGIFIKSKIGYKQRKFCSETCRVTWWNAHPDQVNRKANYTFTCANCGKTFAAYGNQHRKYCSHACYISGRYGREVSAHD